VFLKGKYYSRAALDKLLADVEAAYASQPLRDLATALDPYHVCELMSAEAVLAQARAAWESRAAQR